MYNDTAAVENRMAVSQKIKNRTTILIPPWGIYSKELKGESQRGICTPMFVTLFTAVKTRKQPKCPKMSGEAKCSIYTQWTIIPLKRKEFLTYTTTWMNLEDITLSENKPVTKGPILCDSTCLKYIIKFINRK